MTQQVQDPAVAEAQRKLDEANQGVEKAQSALGAAYKAQEVAEDAHLAARKAAGEDTRERVPAMLRDALESHFSGLASVTEFEMVGDGVYGFLYMGEDRQLPISLTINRPRPERGRWPIRGAYLAQQPQSEERDRRMDELADEGEALIGQLPWWLRWSVNAKVVAGWLITLGWLRGKPWPLP